MMKKKSVMKKEGILLIVNLVLSVVAFSFLISLSSGVVSGANKPAGLLVESGTSGTATKTAEKLAVESIKLVSKGGTSAVLDGVKGIAEKWAGGEISFRASTGGAPTILSNEQIASLTKPLAASPEQAGFFKGLAENAISKSFFHAALIAGGVYMLATMLGEEEEAAKAYGLGAGAGYFTFKMMQMWSTKTSGAWLSKGLGLTWAGWISVGVGLLVIHLLYEKESKKIVTFECHPWEASSGGNDCEKCNSDIYPCTEYRCKSLGQACELLNAGTGEEKCVWVNPRDVKSPIIEPWKEVLTEEHDYKPDNVIRPPDRGVKIEYIKASDKCIKAFTPLEFGIKVNEPAQCKVDYERKDKYEEMQYFFGGSNIYKYNHTQTLSLPGPEAMNAEAPELKNDGTYSLYVRCIDANGNANDDLFVFSFCVEKGPDVTPAKIEGTSIANGAPIQFGLKETPLEVYLNEPAECKWSKTDQSYDGMEHDMECSQHVWEMNNLMLYKCLTTLTDLEDHKENIFYFKCKDQPWLGGSVDRNVNVESYKFTLIGTQDLNIVDVKPEEDDVVTGYSTLATVWLELRTDNGYNFGDSWCSYTTVENADEDDYIQMFETGGNLHKQRLDLPSGKYKYYFQCVDLGGNADYAKTEFEVEIDTEDPKVVRVYQDAGKLKVITDEKSTCTYSNNKDRECNFMIEEGTNMPYANSTEHNAEWSEGMTYYIKCMDVNGRQPLAEECSIVVMARD